MTQKVPGGSDRQERAAASRSRASSKSSGGIYSEKELRDPELRKRKDIERRAAAKTPTRHPLADRPGEAQEKMMKAGVLTPEGRAKEITGYHVDPTTGAKRFVAKGEPIPTFIREPEVAPEVPLVIRDPVIQDPMRPVGLEPKYLLHKDEYTSGTYYQPTGGEPAIPEKVREPGYFERKLQAWDVAVSKVIPSLRYYEEAGAPYREKYGWKQPKMVDVPVSFAKSAYREIEQKPVTTSAKAAAFIAITKGIGVGTGFVRTIPKIGKPIAEKVIPTGLAGVGIGYGATVHKRVTAPEITVMHREIAGTPFTTEERITRERSKVEKAAIAGKIFADEILPMGIGGAIGVKPIPKARLPTVGKTPKVKPHTEPTLKYRVGRPKTEVEKFAEGILASQKLPKQAQIDIKGVRHVSPETRGATYIAKVQASLTDPLGGQTPIYTGISVIGKKPSYKVPVSATVKKIPKPPDVFKDAVPVTIKKAPKPKDVFKEAESKFRETGRELHQTRLKDGEQLMKSGRQELIIKTKQVQKQKIISKQIQLQMQEPSIKPVTRVKTRSKLMQKQKEVQKQVQKQIYVYPTVKTQKQMMLQAEKQKYAILEGTLQRHKEKQLYYIPTQQYLPAFRLDQVQLPAQKTKQVQALKQTVLPKEVLLPKEVQITRLKPKKPAKIIGLPIKEPKKKTIRKKKKLSKATRWQIKNPSAAVSDFMSKSISSEVFMGTPKGKIIKRKKK